MLKKEILKFKNQFDPLLKKKLKKEESLFFKEYSLLIREIERVTFSGGKRIRPLLVCWGYQAVGGGNFADVVDACFSIELFHTFALIHDDIMDKSEKRRGKITTWKKIGVDKAILTGDLCLSLADEYFPQKANKKYFNLLKKETCLGQYLDIQNNKEFSEKQVRKILDFKTAKYTIVRPLQIGASFKTQDDKIMKLFLKYGKRMGTAFQIKDDLLGVFGEDNKTGKPVGEDISEGKKTLLIAKLKKIGKSMKKKEKEKFSNLFNCKKRLNKSEQKFIINLFKKYNIDKEVIAEMQKEAEQARKIINNSDIKEKEKLLQMTQYLINREH